MLETYVLHLTKKCNMNCTYCYEKDKTSTYTWEEIKVTLDNIVRYNKHFVLEFLGGEPCLEMGLLTQTVDYLDGMDDVEVERYIITTNGTIVDDVLIDLLKTNDRVVWAASIDGTKFANFMRVFHDGKNSHDTVIKNFKTLLDILGEDRRQLGCHMVTHPYNIGYFQESVDSLYNKGFRFIDVGIVESTMTIDAEFCKEFIKQHKLLSDRIKCGELSGVMVTSLNSMKPDDDSRHYVKDESGKVILETYGRSDGDIKDSDEYKTKGSFSPLGTMIQDIRREVYNYHNE